MLESVNMKLGETLQNHSTSPEFHTFRITRQRACCFENEYFRLLQLSVNKVLFLF
jgi:hypothetical protein